MSHARPLLIYVHGYANLNDKIHRRLRALQQNFDVNVLGFAWPSRGSYDAQRNKARESLQAFSLMLEDVFRAQKLVMGGPVSLMTHSMGNVLLQHFAVDDGASSSSHRSQMARFIMMSADLPWKGHATWTPPLSANAKLSIFYNNPDWVLSEAEHLHGPKVDGRRIGRGPEFDRDGNLTFPADPAATYFDVTGARGLGEFHTYFQGRPMRRNRELKTLVRELVHGGNVSTRKLRRLDLPVPGRSFRVS